MKTADRDAGVRQWITSCLMSGYKEKQLREVLVKMGFTAEEVEQEISSALPYIDLANDLKKMLNAREGLLKTLDHQMRSLPHYLKIERVTLPPLKQFLEEYYYPNRPGLFSGGLDDCAARHWTPRSLVGKVGADTLVEIQYEYGDRYEQNSSKYAKKVKFGEFIDKVENTESSNSFYLTGGNHFYNREPLLPLRNEIQVGDGYLVPETQKKRMHFMIGPKGTLTKIHYDIVNNLFIQVYGRKLFRLVPAMQVPYLYNTILTYTDLDILDPKRSLYPDFTNATVIEIEVGPGDCLFIPVGWWHHVTSLSISISVACTNINIPADRENMLMDSGKIFYS